MISFIFKRLLSTIPLLIAVSILVFILLQITPGNILDTLKADPSTPTDLIDRFENDYGLNQPWYTQYGKWLLNLLQGNLGESWLYFVPVESLIASRVVATVTLSATSMLLAYALAIPLGVMAAIKKDSWFDKLSAALAYSFISLPEFFFAILAVYFATTTGWFPVGGRTDILHHTYTSWQQFTDIAYHLILPTLVLGIGGVAGIMRIMRANFIDTMHADFARTARAKGLPEKRVMFQHVLRNAINPLVTSFGFAFTALLSGSLLAERVFNYPGLGLLFYESITRQDQPVVLASILMGVILLMIGNLLADILLAWTDPRIRLESADSKQPKPTRALTWIALGIAATLASYIFLDQHYLDPNTSESTQALLAQIGNILLAGLKYLSIAAIILIALACFVAIGFVLYTLSTRYLKAILKQPRGAIAFGTLALLYLCALLAPFLAPYSVSRTNLFKTFHPPTALTWQDGRLQVATYTMSNPDRAEYTRNENQALPVTFFAKSEPYTLINFGFGESWSLGKITWDRHLFGVDSPDGNSRIYLMGSDDTGRCVFSRLLYGARVSLTIGLIGISITMVMGFLVGGLSGYLGGSFDYITMRTLEFLMAIPGLYLLLSLRNALVEYFESDQIYLVIIVILSIVGWAGVARVIRGMTLSIRQRPFVYAAQCMGQPTLKILIKHILPNLSSYLLVTASLAVPGYILGEAALSFLGLGINDPQASWGLMLSYVQKDLKVFFLNFWWLLSPAVLTFITVIAFNVFGDVLRDIVDPKMKTQNN